MMLGMMRMMRLRMMMLRDDTDEEDNAEDDDEKDVDAIRRNCACQYVTRDIRRATLDRNLQAKGRRPD